MNKKASFQLAGEMTVWLFRIFVLIIVVITLAVIVNAYVKNKIDTSGLEQRIIVTKILMQPGCFSYYDTGNNRWLAYSIDINNFDNEILTKCLVSDNVGLRLKLEYNGKNEELAYNERMLGYLQACNSKNNQFSCDKSRLMVKVAENNVLYDGMLDYEVITKNG